MGKSTITLGWEVTSTLEPSYWIKKAAKSGMQSESDLVTVPSHLIGMHTAIIAQSGSGKSFFLGRLMEEIITKTKCRCVVLDPNADFRRIHEVEDTKLWSEAKYNSVTRRGKLPHEKNREIFSKLWSNVGIHIQTSSNDSKLPYRKLNLWWPSVSIELISEDISPILRSELYHCHRFVKAIAGLALNKTRYDNIQFDILEAAQSILRHSRVNGYNLREELMRQFSVALPEREEIVSKKFYKNLDKLKKIILEYNTNKNISIAESAVNFISDEISRYYFGKVHEYKAAGVLETKTQNKIKNEGEANGLARLEIVDLPSLQDKNTRLLAISSILNNEWDRARTDWNDALKEKPDLDKRVPTFIVVDEAHNLIPAQVKGNAEAVLREKFRTILAEGRKYGLFLILVSQRPDKLDPLIISECENRAIMKISSASVLESTKKMLGLDDVAPKVLERCLDFPSGRVLLVGPWAGINPKYLYCAARRTIEGGRDLRQDYWATEPN